MASITGYLKEAYTELKKVQWPTNRETIRSTLVVVGISLAVAAFLGVVDFLLVLGLEKVIVK